MREFRGGQQILRLFSPSCVMGEILAVNTPSCRLHFLVTTSTLTCNRINDEEALELIKATPTQGRRRGRGGGNGKAGDVLVGRTQPQDQVYSASDVPLDAAPRS